MAYLSVRIYSTHGSEFGILVLISPVECIVMIPKKICNVAVRV